MGKETTTIAEMKLEGTLCHICGIYVGPGVTKKTVLIVGGRKIKYMSACCKVHTDGDDPMSILRPEVSVSITG